MAREEDRELEPGQLLGRYRIQGLLGRTPWASTYAAHEGDVEVAIKLAANEGSDELLAELSALREPNRTAAGSLAAIEEGTDGDTKRPFLVTALCSNPSLADLVAVCPLSTDEVIGLVGSLAKALASLHESGAGHLAIKPTNVFVGPPPTHEVTIGDLGADLLRRAAKARHPWLAPEQVDGTGDPRTDVHALGLLVFFALTGSAYSSSDEEMRGPRIAPSLRARDLGAELDPALDAVLLRALSEDASARFASARAFADALSVHGEAALGVAPPPPPARPSERHLKATAKLVRFELREDAPVVGGQTVKMPKVELPEPLKETARMPRAIVPSGPRGVKRFEMPKGTSSASTKRTWRIAIAVGAIVIALAILLLILARR